MDLAPVANPRVVAAAPEAFTLLDLDPAQVCGCVCVCVCVCVCACV